MLLYFLYLPYFLQFSICFYSKLALRGGVGGVVRAERAWREHFFLCTRGWGCELVGAWWGAGVALPQGGLSLAVFSVLAALWLLGFIPARQMLRVHHILC